MRYKALIITNLALLLIGCQSHNTRIDPVYNHHCLAIRQTLDHQNDLNATTPAHTLKAAERAHLVKRLNQGGCHDSSDFAYRNPHESLSMNARTH